MAYGPKGRRMSVAPLSLPEDDDGVATCVFRYEKYMLDYDRILGVEEKEFWEEQMEHHCLLLPYVQQNSTFTQQFGVVYHDWDAGGMLWGKVLPKLYKALLNQDVLDKNCVLNNNF